MRAACLALVLLLAACGGDAPAPAPAEKPVGTLVASPAGEIELRVGGEVRTLCSGFAEVLPPALHHDAERFCFLARTKPDAPWALYTAALDGSGPKSVNTTVDEHSAPAWLPDDRIVVSAPTVDASRALFVVDPASETAERITFSGTDARDPCVLKDGRVLFASMRTTRSGRRAPALFTVHPDGTGVLLFHGATPGDAYERPLQVPGGNVIFDVRTAGGVTTMQADWRAPHEAASVLAISATRPGDICFVRPRPRPQGHMSTLDDNAPTGSLLCVDARRRVDSAAGFVRLHARMLEPEAGSYAWRELGRVPLEQDGSFFASVPADTPLRLDVLGADGRLLQASRTPFWVRPGEIRGCTGCHHAPDVTPPNQQPAAALNPAVVPAREGAR